MHEHTHSKRQRVIDSSGGFTKNRERETGKLKSKTENKSQKRTGHHHAHSHTPTCNLLRYKSVQALEDTNFKLQSK